MAEGGEQGRGLCHVYILKTRKGCMPGRIRAGLLHRFGFNSLHGCLNVTRPSSFCGCIHQPAARVARRMVRPETRSSNADAIPQPRRRGERPTDLASARLPANVAWLDLLNPVPDETSPQPLGSGRRNDPPPSLADDACQEPKVCRLTGGAEWIRKFSSGDGGIRELFGRISGKRPPGRVFTKKALGHLQSRCSSG